MFCRLQKKGKCYVYYSSYKYLASSKRTLFYLVGQEFQIFKYIHLVLFCFLISILGLAQNVSSFIVPKEYKVKTVYSRFTSYFLLHFFAINNYVRTYGAIFTRASINYFFSMLLFCRMCYNIILIIFYTNLIYVMFVISILYKYR